MNTISKIGSQIPVGFEPFELPGKDPVGGGAESFGATLSKSLSDVSELLGKADKAAGDIAVGKSENLHGAMIDFEKAESAFKLLMQVRNRALDAYHEVMRMQV